MLSTGFRLLFFLESCWYLPSTARGIIPSRTLREVAIIYPTYLVVLTAFHPSNYLFFLVSSSTSSVLAFPPQWIGGRGVSE